MPRLRLQPFSRGLYIDLSSLPDKYRDIGRLVAKEQAKWISHRFIYSSASLSMWQMFACQSSPILIWSEDDRLTLSYYRLISKYLSPIMKEKKAELEMKCILVFGERYPPSNRAMRQAHGAADSYSVYQKEREKEEMSLLYVPPLMVHDKPCAGLGLISYRYKGRYGWIMIGAHNNADALREAGRSTDELITIENLQVWDKEKSCYLDLDNKQLNYIDPIHSSSYAASSLGRLGGLVKSEAKSTSSRANGRKGGRPKSTKSIDMDEI